MFARLDNFVLEYIYTHAKDCGLLLANNPLHVIYDYLRISNIGLSPSYLGISRAPKQASSPEQNKHRDVPKRPSSAPP